MRFLLAIVYTVGQNSVIRLLRMDLEKVLLILVSIFTSTLVGAVAFLFKRQDLIKVRLGVHEGLLERASEEVDNIRALHSALTESDKRLISLSERQQFLAKKIDTTTKDLGNTNQFLRESLDEISKKMVTEKRVIILLTEHFSIALAPFRKQLENSEQNRRESTATIDKKLDKIFEMLEPISRQVAQQEIINENHEEKIKDLQNKD